MNRITRTEAVQKILHSNGKMFSVSWRTKDGNPRRLNGKFTRRLGERRNEDKIFGLIQVCESRSKKFRRVDCRTITGLSIDKQEFTVR